MKKYLVWMMILSVIIGLLTLEGCSPSRVSMADVVKWYGADADMGVLLEWTGITPSDDKTLMAISKDFSSIARGLLVYIPSYSLGTFVNPKSLWQDILIVVDTPGNISDEAFAKRVATFLNKWFDVKAEVSVNDGAKLSVMGGDLYVYTIGNLKVLSGKKDLKKQSQPGRYISAVLTQMLSLDGDYRIAVFHRDTYGVFSFKGNSTDVIGKLKLKNSVNHFLKIDYLPQYVSTSKEDAYLFLTVSGDEIGAFYDTIKDVISFLVPSLYIPENMQITLIVPSYSDDDLVVFAVGGIYVNEFEKMLKSFGEVSKDASLESRDVNGIQVYVLEGIQFAYVDGIIYISPNGDAIDKYISKLFIPQHRKLAKSYREMISGDKQLLVAFARVPTPTLPSNIKLDIPRNVSVVIEGGDVQKIRLKMGKPINLKDEIYRLMGNFKNITVDVQMKRKINQAKAVLIPLGFNVADYHFQNGVYPEDKRQLLEALNSYVKQQVWLDGRNLEDVILSGDTRYIVGADKAVLCILIPKDYRDYAGGKYVKVDLTGFSNFVSPPQPTASGTVKQYVPNPEDYVLFSDVCP